MKFYPLVFIDIVLSGANGCQPASISSVFVTFQFWESLMQTSLTSVCGYLAQTELGPNYWVTFDCFLCIGQA